MFSHSITGNWTDSTKFFGFEPDQGYYAIPAALRAGYRHFDGAFIYGTHRILGASLGAQLASGTPRSELFVTTKVFHPPGSIALNRINKSMDIANIPVEEIKNRVLYDFERSLDELSFGYVDLLLMHWPGAFNTIDETQGRLKREQCWRAFEEIYASGRARSIGVSNFQRKHLVSLLEDAKVAPMVNQIEVNPYIGQSDTVSFCKEHGIVVEAWAPFGSGATGVLQDAVIVAVAERHGKNPGQVILRWLFQKGMVSLPRSGNEARMRSNLEIFDFSLSDDEMTEISALDKNITSVDSSDSIA